MKTAYDDMTLEMLQKRAEEAKVSRNDILPQRLHEVLGLVQLRMKAVREDAVHDVWQNAHYRVLESIEQTLQRDSDPIRLQDFSHEDCAMYLDCLEGFSKVCGGRSESIRRRGYLDLGDCYDHLQDSRNYSRLKQDISSQSLQRFALMSAVGALVAFGVVMCVVAVAAAAPGFLMTSPWGRVLGAVMAGSMAAWGFWRAGVLKSQAPEIIPRHKRYGLFNTVGLFESRWREAREKPPEFVRAQNGPSLSRSTLAE